MLIALTQFVILINLVYDSVEYNHSLKIKNHVHKRSPTAADKIDEILKGNSFFIAKYQKKSLNFMKLQILKEYINFHAKQFKF